MSLRITLDDTQHCVALQEAKGKRVASDACTATGGKNEELSPGELAAIGVGSCMLFSMGAVALRDKLDIRGTTVNLDVVLGEERIESIDLEFVIPRAFSDTDRGKLERAASLCPIKRSFLPKVDIRTKFSFQKPAIVP